MGVENSALGTLELMPPNGVCSLRLTCLFVELRPRFGQ